jgi:hypothetical protein
MPSLRRALFLSMALLGGCGDSGQITAPTDTSKPDFAARPNPSFQPFAFTVSNCVEPVDVSGTFHQVVTTVESAGGRGHLHFHINAKGTGVGELTGARYQWNDRLFDNDQIVAGQPGSFILNDNTRLVGAGGAPNASFAVQIKVTVNGNGIVTVDRLRVRDTCR